LKFSAAEQEYIPSRARKEAVGPPFRRSGITCSLQIKLHADVRGLKPEPFIKPVRIGAFPVRRKLHKKTTAFARLFDRPPHHLPADSTAPKIAAHAHRFRLGSPSSAEPESRQITELHRSDYFAIQFRDHDPMIRMRLNLIESALMLWH
jgi:hypothetical protein